MNIPGITMVDFPSKLMLTGTPKGGATLTAQLFLKHLGLLEEAIKYDAWVHKYRQKVFYRQQNHKPVSCDKVCGLSGWTCAKLVRSPLDRVVSSYIHVMRSPILKESFPQLRMVVEQRSSGTTTPSKNTTKKVKDASFADFVKAMTVIRNNRRVGKNQGWTHYMPQSFFNPSCSDHPNVYLIPIEEVEDALSAFANETGVVYNATGLTSKHYKRNIPKVVTEFSVHDTWNDTKMKAVPYDLYLTDPQLNAEICELYCDDIVLHAKACSSAWLLQSSKAVQTTCQAERERIVMVCGKESDFFSYDL
jgi:hypothetical protein